MMKVAFFLPLYKNTTKELKVTNQNDKIIGSLKKFNDNRLLNDFGKHVSNKFVSNVRIRSFDKQTASYEIKTTNQLHLFYKMEAFSIWNEGTKIGDAEEQRKLGIAVRFTIGQHEYLAASTIKNLRTITFYSLHDEKEEIIAAAYRYLHPKMNKMELEVFEKNHVDPMLLAGVSYLHTIVS